MIDNSKICDVQQAISHMGDNSNLFIKHFNKFKISSADTLSHLKSLIYNLNFKDAFMLCHSLKGLSSMLGFTSLQQHAKEAEYLFKELAAQSSAKQTETIDPAPAIISKQQQETIYRTYSSIVQDIEDIRKFQPHL